MTDTVNPHAGDRDRSAIWEMLMVRDNVAFAAADWGMVEGDFLADEFVSLHAQRDANPDSWRPAYASLDDYRADWLEQAAATAAKVDMATFAKQILQITSMEQIDINGDLACAHKKFDGSLLCKDGQETIALNWQTLYLCKKVQGRWRICGFVGYMPYQSCSRT